MFIRHSRSITAFALFALLSMLGSLSWATGHPKLPASLPIENIRFDPVFITAGEHNRIKFTVTLADPSLIFPADKLVLEQQRFLPNGNSGFMPIAELYADSKCTDRKGKDKHCDGKHGYPAATGQAFTATVTFRNEVSGELQFRVAARTKHSPHTLLSSPFSIPVRQACGPTGNVLPVKIFEGNAGKRQVESIDFNVPNAGKAFLRLVNGARLGAPIGERIVIAKVAVNGKEVETISKGMNASESIVVLNQGTNRLELRKAVAKPGQRLSARIDACADTLELKPVPDTQRLGNALAAEATLTGLGLPIPSAPISFDLSGLGNIPKQSASTNETGVARITFPPFALEGAGNLTASTVTTKPLLTDTVTVDVIAAPSVSLRQGVSTQDIKEGTTNPVSFFVDLFRQDTLPYQVSFQQSIEPNDGGIELQPNGIQPVNFEARPVGQENRPRIKELPIAINTLKPGHYTVTSRATFSETGETASSTLAVNVLPANATLGIHAPTLQPGSIPIAAASQVIFQAQADGVSNPPATLNLQECQSAPGACSADPQDSSWKTIGDLLDNGQGPDSFAGDGIYSRQLQLSGKAEGQLLYRATAQQGGNTIVSTSTPLQVSRFPGGTDVTASEILATPDNGVQLVAENILVSFLPATSQDRIERIVAQATQLVTGQVGSVTGQIPEIGLFQVKLLVNANLSEAERIAMIGAAINQFKTYDEVRYAEPNLVISLAGTPDDGGTQQWGAPRIHADKAWDAVTTPKPGKYANGSSLQVAIVDTGVLGSHQDLNGQLTADSELGDQYIENGGPGPGHGTGVAAVIAAKHTGTGQGSISGIAHGAQIYSIKGVASGSTQIDIANGSAGIITAANKAEVKVINLSWNQFSPYTGVPEPLALKNALTTAATKGKLVVAAAGNDGLTIPNAVNSGSRFPCSWDNLVLCVGNSSVNTPSAVGSYPQGLATDILHTTGDVWPGSSCGGSYPSNYGPAVDLYAPGTCIYTATSNNNTGYSKRTGTSFSAPQVAGAAAVAWAEMGAATTASTIRDQLIQCSSSTQVQGKPFLDLFKAVSSKARINLVSGEAGYKNLYGVYNKANNKARIVHNIQTTGSGQVESFNLMKTLYLTKADKDNIGYFLIPNGAGLNAISGISNLNPYVEADLTVGTVQQGNTMVYCLKNSAGNCLLGQDAYAFFSEPAKNPDGRVHVTDLAGNPFDVSQNGKQFWEDLPLFNGLPADFNDAVIQIDFGISCPPTP